MYRKVKSMFNFNSLFNKNKTIPTDTMIMSDNLQITMDTRKTRRNNNNLLVSNRTDKDRFILSNLLQANCSYVVFDPNGEYLDIAGKYLQDEGYDIRILNLNNLKYSHKYNPFRYIRCDEDRSKLINIIHNEVVKRIPNQPADREHIKSFANAAYALLEALFLYLELETPPEDQNFSSILKLLKCAIPKDEDYESILDILFNDLKEREREHIAVLKYELFKQIAGNKTENVVVCIGIALAALNMSNLQELTNEDNIDLTSIGDKKTALFCIVPIGYDAFNFIASMLYTQIIDTLCYHAENDIETHKLPEHVRIFFDETLDIEFFKFNTYEAKLASMRLFNMSYVLSMYSSYTFKKQYPLAWEVIIGNIDNAVLNKFDTDVDLYQIKRTIEENKKVFDISNKGIQVFSGNNNSRVKNAEVMCLKGKYTNLPDDLYTLYQGEQSLVWVRGYTPIICNKIKTVNHPKYSIMDANGYTFDLQAFFNDEIQ